MKHEIKNRFIFFGILVIILAGFAFWYKLTYTMEEALSFEVNTKVMPYKIAIATQGSTYKNAIVTNIVNHYKKDSVYIRVLDVSDLQKIEPLDYTTVVILHTWEYGKPPATVTDFVETNVSQQDKFIVLTTSGEGTNTLQEFDALAGESILENTSEMSNQIILRMAEKLQ